MKDPPDNVISLSRPGRAGIPTAWHSVNGHLLAAFRAWEAYQNHKSSWSWSRSFEAGRAENILGLVA